MALIGVAACEQPSTPEASEVEADADDMQAMMEQRLARNQMPGRAVYEAHCAACHEGQVKKAPHREMLSLLPPETILKSLDTGVMREEAAALSPEQRAQTAEFIAGVELGASTLEDIAMCADPMPLDRGKPPRLHNWGLARTNSRFIPRTVAGLQATEASDLQPRQAIQFPGANRARSQPAFAGGRVFVGSHSGTVYALDETSGCAHWKFAASGEVRTAIVVDPWTNGDEGAVFAYFGDVLGYVYAVSADDGTLAWRARADEHPNATITGAPSLHDETLYVPVSSLEVSLAIDPTYECCTFRGSVAAYDRRTGNLKWQTFTIDEPATVQSQNRAGTDMYGPSGAVIWNAPAIDEARQQLYVGTGENMSSPATLTSDAIFAMDLGTGDVRWVFQATANDVWNTACDTANDHSCPPEGGPDFDFGAATMLATTDEGTDLVIAGQKSGWVYALKPDDGTVVWQQQVGRGGIQGGVHFGLATDNKRVYVPISDMADGRTYDTEARPGLHALDLKTGEPLWFARAPEDVCGDRAGCHPGISQAITVAGDLVLAGGMDGVLRVHHVDDGRLLYQLDTTESFDTAAGGRTSGGSFGGAAGPVVIDGTVYVSSGYGIYNHMPGNLLLSLTAGSEPAAR